MPEPVPVDPPAFYEVPCGLWNQEQLADLLRSAGFNDFEFESVTKTTQSNSARELATGLVYGNPLITAIRERGGTPPELVVSELEDVITKECGAAPVQGKMQAIIVKAVKQ